MRLDKYLKVSRLIKRRTLAKEMCDGGRVRLNGRVAKASAEVAAGDQLTLRFGARTLEVRIAGIAAAVRKEQAADLYEVLKDDRPAGSKADEDDEDDEDGPADM